MVWSVWFYHFALGPVITASVQSSSQETKQCVQHPVSYYLLTSFDVTSAGILAFFLFLMLGASDEALLEPRAGFILAKLTGHTAATLTVTEFTYC